MPLRLELFPQDLDAFQHLYTHVPQFDVERSWGRRDFRLFAPVGRFLRIPTA